MPRALLMDDFLKMNSKKYDDLDRQLRKINPHWQERQGRKSAVSVLSSNRIVSPPVIAAVLRTALSFREFQSLALYHPDGYFSQKVDYLNEMPMLPLLMSPFFGRLIGALTFSGFTAVTGSQPVKPSFLSLGAGRGYLDHDLIDYVTGESFNVPGHEQHALAFRKESTFLITDLGRKAVSLAKKELAEVMSRPDLRSRIKIAEMDAINFRLPEAHFGIIYCNELIDSLPAEPVVDIDDSLYVVKVIAFAKSGTAAGNPDTQAIETHLSLTGVLIREEALNLIEHHDSSRLGFIPVFIPLSSDTELHEHFRSLSSAARIKEADFGGIYPLHLHLDDLFNSIRQSFRHGIFIIIDYRSIQAGAHNWNLAVNDLKSYKFGTEDFDFQIDSAQVIEKAARYGIRCASCTDLRQVMQQMFFLLSNADTSEIIRNLQANNRPLNAVNRKAYLEMQTGFIDSMAPLYDVINLFF